MFCEKCGGELRQEENKLICTKCGAEYSAESDIQTPSAEYVVPRGFSSKKYIIIIIVAALLMIGGVGAIVAVNVTKSNSQTALTNIQVAERYLSEQNYEQAIIEFEKILEIEPMNVDAYLGLADAYIGLGDNEKAIEVLKKGLEVTGDSRIKAKLDELIKPVEQTVSSSSSSLETISSSESSSSEPEETPADIPEITGEVSLYEELPFRDREVVCVPGENAFLLEKEDGTYSLVNSMNEPISDPEIKYTSVNFHEEKGYVALGRWDSVTTMNSNFPYDEKRTDVYNANGELLYKDVFNYTDNLIITRTPVKPSEGGPDHEPFFTYTFTNAATGQEVFHINETDYIEPEFGSSTKYTTCYLGVNPSGASVVYTQRVALGVYTNAWMIDDTHYVNIKDKLKAYSGFGQIDIRNVRLFNSSNCLYISYGENNYDREAFSAIYNLDTDKFIDYKMPEIEGDIYVAGLYPDDDIICYEVYESAENSTLIAATFDGTVLCKGVNYFSDIGDYYLCGYSDKWELIMKDTGERHAFDDATNFWQGYAFVVENGMGHFINTKFEKVSNDIPATGASVFYNSGVIRLSTQGKYYRLKVNS